MHGNGSNRISNKTASDEFISLLCYLIKYQIIICYSSYLYFFIFCLFTLKITQLCNITGTYPLTMHQFEFIPKIFKLNCQKKTDRHQNIFLNLWIKKQLIFLNILASPDVSTWFTKCGPITRKIKHLYLKKITKKYNECSIWLTGVKKWSKSTQEK